MARARPQSVSKLRANRLRELREAAGLSMQDLAKKVLPTTTPSQINKLEKGTVNMTLEWMRKLGDALEVHYLEIAEPLPKLSPRQQKLLSGYGQLAENEQNAVFQFVDTMAQSPQAKAGNDD